MLNNPLSAMEINDMHLLNYWGFIRMAGFLDVKIILLFLDTIISTGIGPDETKYIASQR